MLHDPANHAPRRAFMRRILAAGLCVPASGMMTALAQSPPPQLSAAPELPVLSLSPEDDQVLNELDSGIFLVFWEQASPKTGMVKDRCNIHDNDQRIVASIAATGFGLTALCIGEQRGFISKAAALERVFTALRFLWKKVPHHRGFFYHFANINTGERICDSDISSVDTAILLCGMLTCSQPFKHPNVAQLADLIFSRVDWTWLSEDTSLLPHGWTPEI